MDGHVGEAGLTGGGVRQAVPPGGGPVEEARASRLPKLPEEDAVVGGGLVHEEVGVGRRGPAAYVGPEGVSGGETLSVEVTGEGRRQRTPDVHGTRKAFGVGVAEGLHDRVARHGFADGLVGGADEGVLVRLGFVKPVDVDLFRQTRARPCVGEGPCIGGGHRGVLPGGGLVHARRRG